jgi:hypothetical protein
VCEINLLLNLILGFLFPPGIDPGMAMTDFESEVFDKDYEEARKEAAEAEKEAEGEGERAAGTAEKRADEEIETIGNVICLVLIIIQVIGFS